MNLLRLISPWLDINYQITTKYATVPKPKLFRELNTAEVFSNGVDLILSKTMSLQEKNLYFIRNMLQELGCSPIQTEDHL